MVKLDPRHDHDNNSLSKIRGAEKVHESEANGGSVTKINSRAHGYLDFLDGFICCTFQGAFRPSSAIDFVGGVVLHILCFCLGLRIVLR